MKLKAWISAMRLRTLPLAASCVLMGSAVAWKMSLNGWVIFGLTLLMTILLQVLSNFANDYGDYSHGVDNDERVGPERALQSGVITKGEMKAGLIITAFLTLASGILLVWYSFSPYEMFGNALLFVGIGVVSIIAALKYTMGKNPYGYRGLGDVFVFVFFGLIGVTGTYFLHSHQWSWHVLAPAVTIGMLSCAVLNLNNMRDHVNDKASGKITIVVRMGYENAKLYHYALVILACAVYAVWLFTHMENRWQIASLLPATVLIAHLGKVVRTEEPADLDGQLKVVALATFLIALIHFVVMVVI